MDYTLLRGSSGMLYLRYLKKIGYLHWWQWPPILASVGGYALGLVSFPHLMGRLMVQAAGEGEKEAWRLSEDWFDTMLRSYIVAPARERVAWHQAQGHQVVVVSAATPYAVGPVAADLGLDDAYLATQLEVADGRFTGRVLEPACYGQGKLVLTRAYAADHGIDLQASFFYSDSHHDLALLQAVGHPIAVNPNNRLARIAAQRGWPILRFY